MKLALVKRPDSSLEPNSNEDRELLRKVKMGSVLLLSGRKVRNGQHHRKLFKLLDLIYENQEIYTNPTDLLVDIKIKAGHYTEYITREGQLVYLPKSISFGEMEQHDFDVFYSRVIDIAVGDPDFLKGMSREELEAAVTARLNFA